MRIKTLIYLTFFICVKAHKADCNKLFYTHKPEKKSVLIPKPTKWNWSRNRVDYSGQWVGVYKWQMTILKTLLTLYAELPLTIFYNN